MTKQLKLHAEKRGRKEKLSMREFIPAVIYGPGREPESLKLKRADFEEVFAVAGESNLINLTVAAENPVKALVKDTQREVVKDKISHVDFYQVDMKKKITAEIPLHFIGEAKAVKELGGVLVKGADTVKAECLPGDLIDHFDVDISSLSTFHDFIRVKDLKLPPDLELLEDGEEILAHVVPPKVEEEIKPAEAAVAEAAGTEAAATEAKGEEKEAGEKKTQK